MTTYDGITPTDSKKIKNVDVSITYLSVYVPML